MACQDSQEEKQLDLINKENNMRESTEQWSFKKAVKEKKFEELCEKLSKDKNALLEKQKNDSIMFMPENGICWSCHNDITKHDNVIRTIARGSTVTGCPYCNRSYVD